MLLAASLLGDPLAPGAERSQRSARGVHHAGAGASEAPDNVGRHAVEAHVEELKFSSWTSPQWASPQKVAKASAPLISCTEEEHALGGPTLLPVAARGDPKDDVALLPKGQVRGGPVSTSTLHWLRA